MIKEKIPQLKQLSKLEKRVLAGELWDEVMTIEDVELTSAQKKVLDERIDYAKAHPDEIISWEEMKKDLQKKYNV
jgi:putative addiction module component (TIGR02574 family)